MYMCYEYTGQHIERGDVGHTVSPVCTFSNMAVSVLYCFKVELFGFHILQIKCSIFGSIGMDCVINELCYKGTNIGTFYEGIIRKMTIKW